MDQCSRCRFFRPVHSAFQESAGGECRRHPPATPKNSQRRARPDIAIFPAVMETDWCGEFVPRRDTSAHRRNIEANAAFDAAAREDATDAAACGLTRDV
ncbi:hypothetical protein [Rubripirellula lacrimiformis]|nr:hypothetical protein [Rubripirellula lacrimiformis]